VWAIGNESGFLAAPVNLTATNNNQLLMALAERADLIVDFTNVPAGNYILGNAGPDEPYGGGLPGADFEPADPDSTGQVLQFRVVPTVAPDPTTPPRFLRLPPRTPLPTATLTRQLALIEEADVGLNEAEKEVEGPVEALLGIVQSGFTVKKLWMDDVTENPALGATEIWEIYNTTADAHPMHIHEVAFEVVNRQDILSDDDTGAVQIAPGSVPLPPKSWETGVKDTVTALPSQVTRLRLRFTTLGQFVWHCHIVEHEDNEMMRPYRIGPAQPGQPE